MKRPPRLAERLLAKWLPPAEVEFALGDLAEQFANDVAAQKRLATMHYYWQALAVLWHVRSAPNSSSHRRRPGERFMTKFIYDLAAAADSRKLIRRAGRAGAGEVIATGCWATFGQRPRRGGSSLR